MAYNKKHYKKKCMNKSDNTNNSLKQKKSVVKYSLFLLVALIIIAVTLIALNMTGVLSWFRGGAPAETSLGTSLTDYKLNITYNLDGSNNYNDMPTTLNTDMFNTSAANYIGKLKTRIEYTGNASAYLRVKINEEFKQGNAVVPKLVSTEAAYSVNTDDWYYSQIDGYYYYRHLINDEIDQSIQFISNNYSTQNIPQIVRECSADIDIIAEAVQPDRYDEFWGVPQSFMEGTVLT